MKLESQLSELENCFGKENVFPSKEANILVQKEKELTTEIPNEEIVNKMVQEVEQFYIEFEGRYPHLEGVMLMSKAIEAYEKKYSKDAIIDPLDKQNGNIRPKYFTKHHSYPSQEMFVPPDQILHYYIHHS